MKINKFEDLECWKAARTLNNLMYSLTRGICFVRDMRLKSQLTGASISVMNNIAEGFDSQSNAEFIRFLKYARRSASEVRNCLYIAADQSYIDDKQLSQGFSQTITTMKLIDGLLRYLRGCRKG